MIRLRKSFLLGPAAQKIIHTAHVSEQVRLAALTPEQRAAESAQVDGVISDVNALAEHRREQRQISDEVAGQPIGPGSA